MPGRPLRVGVISANWGMLAHLPAWRAVGVEVTAVCTSRQETAEVARRRYRLSKAYWDHAAMAADPDLDIIDVGTRPDLRREMVLAALAAGKHVFAAANFAADLTSAREMRDARRAAGLVGALDSTLPWIPAHRLVKRWLEAGELGRPISVSTQLNIGLFNGPRPVGDGWRWFAERRHGASALRNLGTHSLHLLVHLLGPVEAVAGQATKALPQWRFTDGSVVRPEVEDTAQLLLRFASGVMGSVAVGWSSPAWTGWRMELSGDRATVVTHDEGTFPTSRGTRLFRGQDGGRLEPREIPEDFVNPAGVRFATDPGPPQAHDIAAAMQAMVGAIRGDGAALPDFEAAYHVEAVLEAARRAIDGCCWVDVAGVEPAAESPVALSAGSLT